MTRTTACAGAAVLWACAAALSALPSAAAGQPGCEPGWAEPFPNVPLISGGGFGEVRALAVFDDGSGPRLYAGGIFTQASGQPARGFMRWETDHWEEAAVVQGTPLSSYPVGIYFITVMDIGSGPELFAGGQFSSIDGVPVTGIARWDGQTWSPMGAGFDLQARALAMYDDGTGPALYAAGRFTKSGATPCRGLARWTGSAWEQVSGGLGGDGLALVAMDLGQGPRLYVGGKFQLSAATPGAYWRNVAVWTGTSWSGLGNGVEGWEVGVLSMMMFDHGEGPQLTIGGSFDFTIASQAAPRVARWTGSQWVQVGQTLPGSYSDYVSCMAALPGPTGPRLYVGGSMPFTFGSAARLDNGVWTSLAVNGLVRSMVTTDEGGEPVLYASGSLTLAGNSTANRVARWAGDQWDGLEHGGRGLVSGWAKTACVFDDGSGDRAFVGGTFIAAGDEVCRGIAAWDGQSWNQLAGGMTYASSSPFFGGVVYALSPFSDGTGTALYATGSFELAGGIACRSVARWDGASWSAPGGDGIWWQLPSGVWQTGFGTSMVVHDDGSGPALYVGGQIMRAAGAPASGIARWNGNVWSGLGNGAGVGGSDYVQALAVFDEGAGPCLFVGGVFASFAGAPGTSAIARWNGTAWSSVGGGFPATAAGPSQVIDLAVVASGGSTALVAAGGYGAGPPSDPLTSPLLLARWDGQSWTPLATGAGTVPVTGTVRHVWSFDDGDGPALYVGGALRVSGVSSPAGVARRRAGMWDLPAGGVTAASSSGLLGVYGTAARRENDQDVLLMTGSFDRAGGVESINVAEWRACRVCYGDCNRDAVLSSADFGCFQSRFLTADPWADCNTDGALTVQDFGCFQTKFVTGCP